MLTRDVIERKRDGGELNSEQIGTFISAVTDGSAGDAQVGAFAMAVLLNGMTRDERVALTLAMRDSGDVLDWNLDSPVVDKHSTGGVGDNVSLILAPALAACGANVPMISGRGLGHTGGTLDKFDAIPGYQTQPDVATLRRVVEQVGCAIIGQTGEIAPADKRLYGIRDVTGTVESIDLVCASILSKKLAAGLDALVLDVKVGSGAVMQDFDKARGLAETLVSVANGAGCSTTALITDMNEPLATAAGNALEVTNAVQLLSGEEIDTRLWDVSVALGGELLVQSKLCDDVEEGREKISTALQNGAAAEKFAKMVSALGGPADFMEAHMKHLPHAPVVREIYAARSGFVASVDTRALGVAVVELGGGRINPGDEIDYSVGLDWIMGCGMLANEDAPLLRIHAKSDDDADRAEARIVAAYEITERPSDENPLIVERVA